MVLVVLGVANNLPSIPDLLELVQPIPGLEGIPRLSKYSLEYFFPLKFACAVGATPLAGNPSIDDARGEH